MYVLNTCALNSVFKDLAQAELATFRRSRPKATYCLSHANRCPGRGRETFRPAFSAVQSGIGCGAHGHDLFFVSIVSL